MTTVLAIGVTPTINLNRTLYDNLLEFLAAIGADLCALLESLPSTLTRMFPLEGKHLLVAAQSPT